MTMRICIDPGHGGTDNGATANGLIEKKINLDVSLIMQKLFKEKYSVELLMTRETDETIDSDKRIKMVNNFNPHLCISVHHNAADNSSARGAEVIHAHYDEYDDHLALMILEEMSKIGMPARRAFTKLNDKNEDWYYMIRRIWDNDTKAIIFEGGFLTNAKDAELLKNEEFLKKEAEVLVKCIANFLNLKPKLSEVIKVDLKVPPFIIGQELFLPARFLAERLGAKVIWDNYENKTYIMTDNIIIETKTGINEVVINK